MSSLLVHSLVLPTKRRPNNQGYAAVKEDSPEKQEILYSRKMELQPDFSTLHNVPLRALGHYVRCRIASYLNVRSSLVTSNGRRVTPDYLGLAELASFSPSQTANLRSSPNPTSTLLDQWKSTVGQLCEALLELERLDVLDDVRPQIDRDVCAWRKAKESQSTEHRTQTPAPDDIFRPGEISDAPDDTFRPGEMADDRTDHWTDEYEYMVLGDQDKKKMYFDAFVCYAPEDILFVKELARNLEAAPYNRKLCIQDRDIIPGAARHPVAAKLIEERCKRMLVVLSPHYLSCPSCDFQTKFAQAISEDARCKRIIPILLEPCEVPTILRPLTLCDFTRGRVERWFWGRVAKALENKSADLSSTSDFSSPLALNDIYLNLSDSPIPWSDQKLHTFGASSDSSKSVPSGSVAPIGPVLDSLSQSLPLPSTSSSGRLQSSRFRPSPPTPTDHNATEQTPNPAPDALSRSEKHNNTYQSEGSAVGSDSDDTWTVIKQREIDFVRRPWRSPGLRLSADTDAVYDVLAERVTLWPIRTTDSPEEGWPWEH